MKHLTAAFILLALAPGLAQAGADAPARRPNIVFILADDLGYTDVATFGSKYYETPNIDRLATQGMKLTSHHHCQNCAPTRGAL
ncbi:MAG: sulfatase-like hydrolase/transferase, partial [bacterium]